jgi:hypothetical protein
MYAATTGTRATPPRLRVGVVVARADAGLAGDVLLLGRGDAAAVVVADVALLVVDADGADGIPLVAACRGPQAPSTAEPPTRASATPALLRLRRSRASDITT